MMTAVAEPPARLQLPDEQPITARLAGAASLRRELEALLAAASLDASPSEYHDLLIGLNAAGKTSAAARMWAWKRLKLRYALDPSLAEHRAFVAGMRATADVAERGLLECLMFARTDRLFREVTLEHVSPYLVREGTVLVVAAIADAICERIRVRHMSWSSNTIDRASKHLLTALKDFGLLHGSRVRRTVRPRPGGQTTLFAARLARLEGLTERQVVESRWFCLLGLQREQVTDLLYTANRNGVLEYRTQADVVHLKLPQLEEA
jgi:hypothetical protein